MVIGADDDVGLNVLRCYTDIIETIGLILVLKKKREKKRGKKSNVILMNNNLYPETKDIYILMILYDILIYVK